MTKRVKRNARSVAAMVLVILVTVIFSARLFQIQVVQASAYNEVSKDKRAVPVSIPGLRGDIADRNGVVLASTDERYDVQLSPKNTLVRDGVFYRQAPEGQSGTVAVTTEEAYAEIAEITGQTADELRDIVDSALAKNKKSDFAYVQREVTLDQLNALKALKVPWLTFAPNYQRFYPNGGVAGNLIGFSSSDQIPQAGVERSQDACLAGTDGVETYEKGADGVALPGSHVVREKAENGGTVELTIDRDLQWQAQQLVDEYNARLGTEWVYAVLMDAKTGELLAVAEDGSVDPGDLNAGDPEKREARSFVRPYEPGSTHKTVTVATLLEEGVATPLTPYDTPWTMQPEAGVRFSDWFEHAVEPWTLTGIYVKSSNVGTAMLGTQVPAKTRYEYMRKFGLGESTDTGLPLEDSGLLYKPEKWDAQTSYNVTFGQGFSSTIIQTAGVYQTIANGGVRIPPKLVKGCRAQDGSFTPHESGDPVNVVSQETASSILQMMETLVDDTWKDFLTIPGYRIGGKTGTGEQSDGQGHYRTDYVHSFASIFPIDDPQYVVVASLGFPDSYTSGTTSSVSLVREIEEAAIRTLQVAPSTGTFEPLPIYSE
ncbi:peptidoglycan D,D-transpeptidase FtsI family protein [Leucobacter chinensis]|uniref:peptidoglycan D,D-transpeptidase FtsI family protein n=1 Tax=Leucobacter chinensis TaxID=2851010 RepID=UPI001C22A93F|nr:penicillin-binding protein 2 [Leucobacter chinensis]